jgi:aminoglycoside phosphotransferase (APT) family kinase protein
VLTVHPDEIVVPPELVRQLLRAQFPRWAELKVERVPSYGTDNVLFRLGDELLVRLPRLRASAAPRWALTQIEKDRMWLPRLAPHLPVAVPEIVALGAPSEDYPHTWAVYRWLDGEPPTHGSSALAHDIATFLAALQRIDTTAAPPGTHRGGPLALRDADTRAALAQLEKEVDVPAATAAWDAALATPPWPHDPVLLHGDLLEGNLLVRGGRLTAVIDWACACAGDPAFDYSLAWSLLAPVRDEFRTVCGVDDDTAARARGLALSQALIALPYYRDTNPPIVARSRLVIREVLGDDPPR